jgi:hypothetical protein
VAGVGGRIGGLVVGLGGRGGGGMTLHNQTNSCTRITRSKEAARGNTYGDELNHYSLPPPHLLPPSQVVAGVTLLALGNGAADIITAMTSVEGSPSGGNLAISGLIGSALFGLHVKLCP